MAKIKYISPFLLSFIILSGLSFTAAARTNLVSLPQRQHVAIRLGTTGKTLVQEKRIMLFKKGINKVDFSWQNVEIDPSSITLTTLSNPDKISILSVSYPPGEAALVWDIKSLANLEEEVMISYLLANIDGIITYKAVTGPGEQAIDLNSYIVLRNFSGENFNKIAVYLNDGKPFITSLHHLETKRILVLQKQNIPIKKLYTWNSLKMPHEPEKLKTAVGIPTSYEFYNNKDSGLGTASLLRGKARIFQRDNQKSTIFLGEDTAKFTPVGDKTDIRIGDSRDIVVTKLRLDTKRTNIKRNTKGSIQVYDEYIKNSIAMENLKDKPVTLSLVETIQGQWEPLDISMDYKTQDHKTLIFNIKLLPKEKKSLNLNYKVLNIFVNQFSQYNRVVNYN
ncbi:MAG: DUF4139 domain-containing protein [Deltaproteobacteria bacterium]|nr:DUF4139 domain-containing protein [Deltaproteobacteria bacterium]